jgi:hypothetical protein
LVVLKKGSKQDYPTKWLVVQAEVDGAGKTVYGLIGIDDVRRVSSDEVAYLKSLTELEKEEQEAEMKEREKKKK